MFNIFTKNDTKLSDLIPKNFVDIHSHILPGIDDGAKNVDESIHLISKMKSIGFGKIIATPHVYPGVYNNDKNTIQKSLIELEKNKVGLKINYACEYMVDDSLIELAEKKALITIKKKFILVEMNFTGNFNFFHEIIFRLRLCDYIPIIAHPERYHNLTLENFTKLKDMGCLLQINLLSTTGFYGKRVLEKAKILLNNNIIDFGGSDIHNIFHINAFEKKIYTDGKIIEEICLKNNYFN